MKTYIDPRIHIISVDIAKSCICASFDPYNETEKWDIEDSEDI